jgi:hypothetical protein
MPTVAQRPLSNGVRMIKCLQVHERVSYCPQPFNPIQNQRVKKVVFSATIEHRCKTSRRFFSETNGDKVSG